MCRVLSYLGDPILVEELLYKPDNSFIKQAYNPKYMSYLLNLAGFGMVAWDEQGPNPEIPFVYKTLQLPFYDENLQNLSRKVKPHCMLTHIRGVSYSEKHVVSTQNVHPFIFKGSGIAFAHNGALAEFEKIKYDLLDYIHPQYQKCIKGTTDSEWIYAIFLSQLLIFKEPNEVDLIIKGINETLKILKIVRNKHQITTNSPVNLFISNGKFLAATRFVFDFGWQPDDLQMAGHATYHSLWYTFGENYGFHDNEYKMKVGKKRTSLIIASEPLTEDTTTWIEVPEYTLIVAEIENNEIRLVSQDINL